MGVLDNLNIIKSCKEDIKQAIADKGVDMTNVAFTEYATKISEIQTGGDYLDMRANMSTYYSTAEKVGAYAFIYCSSLQSVNLPMCISVSDNAFQSCPSLQSANLPMCSFLGSYAFCSCPSLQSANLPICSYVGNRAFGYCSSLQSVNLPMCISVGYSAFSKCSSLQSVNLPICFDIGGSAFADCSLLSVLDLRSTYSCVLASSKTFSETPFASGIGSIYVHNTVLSQFQNATNWTYFSKCLVGVGDPTRPLLSFDSGRVYGDTPLLYNNWKSYLGITSSSVISIDLTNYVSVGNSTFQSCSSLQTVNLPMCSYVGSFAFRSCSSLQSIDLPMCEYVGYEAFGSCSSLQTVNLPMCEYVGEFGFNYCKSLTTINLPKCSYLGMFAFQGVYSISTIYLGTSLSTVCEVGQNPITIGMGTLPDIYVPTSLVSAYKTHPYWSYFRRNIYGV